MLGASHLDWSVNPSKYLPFAALPASALKPSGRLAVINGLTPENEQGDQTVSRSSAQAETKILIWLDVSRSRRDTRIVTTDPAPPPGALTYSRGVYASLIAWYKVADAKGQLLLTLNGIYITVLSSIVLVSPQDLLNRKMSLPPVAWLFLGGAALATVISILSAIGCLRSRLSDARLDKIRDLFIESSPGGPDRYRPAVTFWFGTIARLDRDIGLKMLRSVDETFELAALTEEIFLLAPNVLAKHRWVNRGWVAAGANLLLLLAGVVGIIVAA
jgi:hypothetical protein